MPAAQMLLESTVFLPTHTEEAAQWFNTWALKIHGLGLEVSTTGASYVTSLCCTFKIGD